MAGWDLFFFSPLFLPFPSASKPVIQNSDLPPCDGGAHILLWQRGGTRHHRPQPCRAGCSTRGALGDQSAEGSPAAVGSPRCQDPPAPLGVTGSPAWRPPHTLGSKVASNLARLWELSSYFFPSSIGVFWLQVCFEETLIVACTQCL